MTGPLSQYGTGPGTFTGKPEREDAQPNETLGHKRSRGPPALKETHTPPVYSRGRRPWKPQNFSDPRPAPNSAQPPRRSGRIQSQRASHQLVPTPRWGPRDGDTSSRSGMPIPSRYSPYPPRLPSRKRSLSPQVSSQSPGSPSTKEPRQIPPLPSRPRLSTPTSPSRLPTASPPLTASSQRFLPPLPTRVKKSKAPAPLENYPSISPHASHTEPDVALQVKVEASESSHDESIVSQPKLMKEGCIRFILPDDCQKSNPEYQQCRRDLFKDRARFLKNKGLSVGRRALFREDGMVLDWTSPVPVWSDSLKPESTDLASALTASSHDNALILKEARLKSLVRSQTPPASRGTPSEFSTTAPEIEVEVDDDDRPPKVIRPSQVIPPYPHLPQRTFKPVRVPRVVQRAQGDFDDEESPAQVSEEESGSEPPEATPRMIQGPVEEQEDEGHSGEDLEVKILGLAQQFLRRYVETFDQDRKELEMAYSPDATLTVRVHDANNDGAGAQLFCTEGLSNHDSINVYTGSQVQQGRSRIVERLCSLGPHRFLGVARCTETYDLAFQPMSTSKGSLDLVIVSFHCEAVDNGRGGDKVKNHTVTVDQSFVLRAPDLLEDQLDDAEYGIIKGKPWPLIAIAHQMVVRDGYMLPPEKVGELLPWISIMNLDSSS